MDTKIIYSVCLHKSENMTVTKEVGNFNHIQGALLGVGNIE